MEYTEEVPNGDPPFVRNEHDYTVNEDAYF
jgi:hypothetical protein